MRVLILGGDGYLGWPTALHLSQLGHAVAVADNYFRRQACRELNCEPLLPVPDLQQRVEIWQGLSGDEIDVFLGDVCDYDFLSRLFQETAPEVVVHFAEQPSAPYSMMNREAAVFTLTNNLVSTCNLAHAVANFAPNSQIIRLGTVGACAAANPHVVEDDPEEEYQAREHTFLPPQPPGSLGHLTRTQDSDLLFFYCRLWNLQVTNLNTGSVYGVETEWSARDERLISVFNYDDIFGSVLNRFLVQAVAGHPLTVYGQGGQTRNFLHLKDALIALELFISRPAREREYLIVDHFVEDLSVMELAQKVQEAGKELGLKVKIDRIPNPRGGDEEASSALGHRSQMPVGPLPQQLTLENLVEMLAFVKKHQERIRTDYFLPRIKWGQ